MSEQSKRRLIQSKLNDKFDKDTKLMRRGIYIKMYASMFTQVDKSTQFAENISREKKTKLQASGNQLISEVCQIQTVEIALAQYTNADLKHKFSDQIPATSEHCLQLRTLSGTFQMNTKQTITLKQSLNLTCTACSIVIIFVKFYFFLLLLSAEKNVSLVFEH